MAKWSKFTKLKILLHLKLKIINFIITLNGKTIAGNSKFSQYFTSKMYLQYWKTLQWYLNATKKRNPVTATPRPLFFKKNNFSLKKIEKRAYEFKNLKNLIFNKNWKNYVLKKKVAVSLQRCRVSLLYSSITVTLKISPPPKYVNLTFFTIGFIITIYLKKLTNFYFLKWWKYLAKKRGLKMSRNFKQI